MAAQSNRSLDEAWTEIGACSGNLKGFLHRLLNDCYRLASGAAVDVNKVDLNQSDIDMFFHCVRGVIRLSANKKRDLIV